MLKPESAMHLYELCLDVREFLDDQPSEDDDDFDEAFSDWETDWDDFRADFYREGEALIAGLTKDPEQFMMWLCEAVGSGEVSVQNWQTFQVVFRELSREER